MTTVHVACAAEGRAYVAHSAVMLHSLLERSDGLGVEVHYLHGPRFDPADARLLRAMVEAGGGSIEFLEVPDPDLAGLPVTDQFTKAMWYRIFLPELLPDLARVLYLDADTLIVDSIAPLWATDLTDAYLAAVTNVFQSNHVHRPAELGLAGPHVYFNSGVLLMNLADMRRDGCTAALRECAVGHGDRLEWPDQDALNLVLGTRRVELHPRWNCMNAVLRFSAAVEVFGAAAVEEARRSPAIRHFEGPAENKPWHYLCEENLRDLYFEHRRATPWPDCEIDGASFSNSLRRRVRALRSARRAVSA
ncbi:MAG: hypothetical protein QOI80_1547 [Solirubrobacteraceae bacterium]|nr:hypothetical protein [Solirubrobacteraceae bacterium]